MTKRRVRTPRTALIPGDPPIEIGLRRSARARRLSLRVSAIDGRVTLTLPARASERAGLDFAAEKEGWIRARLSQQPGRWRPVPGTSLPFEGGTLPIRQGATAEVEMCDGAVVLPGEGADGAAKLREFLKGAARARLAAACDRHAAALGRPYGRLALRDPRSRWGSCSATGNLMFSWRLVMAPGAILDYVAAHEVAHLQVMSHSPAFWTVVARLCPDHARARRWLRREGPALHRIDFNG